MYCTVILVFLFRSPLLRQADISSVLSGPEDPVGPEEDGSVLGHRGLCQTHLSEGGSGCVLQGLRAQHAGHHPVRRHRPGCLRGEWL